MDDNEILKRIDAGIDPQRVLDMYNAPFARMMGIEIEHAGKDRTVCSMNLTPSLMNSMGRGHGAAIYALMDHTFAIACNISSDSTGQSSEIKYYRPASGKLTAIAEPINRSRSLEVYSVRAVSEEGKLIASATCTSFIIKKRERTREGPV